MAHKRLLRQTMDVEVEIDINDIIEGIDDDLIVHEVKERELYLELSDWFMNDIPEGDLLDALCSKLSLTKADALRDVYYAIKEGNFENRNLS